MDMGAWVGPLPELRARFNAAQELYSLFELNAAVVPGLRKTPLAIAEWVRELGGDLNDSESGELSPHVVVDEFARAVAGKRQTERLDLVVGVVPVKTADQHSGVIRWNQMSSLGDRAAVVSTVDLRELAAEAGRPRVAALGVLLIGTLVASFNSLLCLSANKRCVLNHSPAPDRMIAMIRTPWLCRTCSELMAPSEVAATEDLLDVVRRMRSPAG